MGAAVDVVAGLAGMLGELECLLDRSLEFAEGAADYAAGCGIDYASGKPLQEPTNRVRTPRKGKDGEPAAEPTVNGSAHA